MPTLADTAYPRLRVSPDGAELSDAFTPTPDELAFAVKRTRQPGPRLALLVMLKTFQRLGYFARPDDVPPTIITHIAATTALGHAVGGIRRLRRGVELPVKADDARTRLRRRHRLWPARAQGGDGCGDRGLARPRRPGGHRQCRDRGAGAKAFELPRIRHAPEDRTHRPSACQPRLLSASRQRDDA